MTFIKGFYCSISYITRDTDKLMNEINQYATTNNLTIVNHSTNYLYKSTFLSVTVVFEKNEVGKL